MNTQIRCLMSCAVALALAGSAHAQEQQKIAQTGFKYLAVSQSARFAGLAHGATAVDADASMMFYNPAGMARQPGTVTMAFGNTRWIADIDHYHGAIAFTPMNGQLGVFGVSIQYVDYGNVIGTFFSNNARGYSDATEFPTLNFKPSAFMVGIGYAREVSEKFSFGTNIKFANQNLGVATLALDGQGRPIQGGNKLGVVALDFGILYRTGFRSLNFGMTVRNFAREIRYVNENFQLPLTFKVGVAMDLVDLTSLDKEVHAMLLAVDAEHPRDYPEQIRVGGEYAFMQTVTLRAGYVSSTDEEGATLGFGLRQTATTVPFGLDYAYTPFGLFGSVHRLTLVFSVQ